MKTQHNLHWYNNIRQKFLLSFFNEENKYQEKEVNGFHLIKQFNSKTMLWEIAIYTKDSYRKRKEHKNRMLGLISRGKKQEREE